MFCMGKELKEDLFLYSYEIKDEMTVQAMVTIQKKQIEDDESGDEDDEDDDDDDEAEAQDCNWMKN